MATYVNDLRLKEISTGDESGTWGTSTNTNLELIGEALGYATEQSFGSDADATTTVADGVSDPARAMYFKVTSAVSLTATRTLTIAPNTVSRVMFIENATSGSQSIAISQGSGANVTIATGKTAIVYLDGAGSGAAVVDAMAGVDPGVTDTLAEVLTAGNTTGGTDISVSTGDDITFADSSKAIFGAGSDLQIYHDGSNSIIHETAAGSLILRGTNLNLQTDANVDYLQAVANGAVTLYHQSGGAAAAKLATTSTGIDVTGSVVSDGAVIQGTGSQALTVSSSTGNSVASFTSTDSQAYISYLDDATTGVNYVATGAQGNDLVLLSGAGIRSKLFANGDFQLYEDTASTPKFFWDASAESLGIGTSSVNYKLNVLADAGSQNIFQAGQTGVSNGLSITSDGSALTYSFLTGSVGIGTSSPNHAVDIYSNENVPLRIHRPSNGSLDSSGAHGIGFSTRGDAATSTSDTRSGIFSYYNGNLFLATNTSDITADPDASARLTVTNTGNVGIGTSSPDEQMHLHGGSSATRLRISGGALNETYGGFIEGEGVSGQGGHLRLGVVDNGTDRVAIEIEEQGNQIVFDTASTERMRIDSSGNVGIGTSSPSNKLHVTSASTGNIASFFEASTGNTNRLYIGANSGLSYIDATAGVGSTALGFKVASTERMRIDSSGNVGIGTTSPTSLGGGAKLTVNQAADGNIVFARGGSTRQVQLGTTSTTGYINADNTSSGLTFNVNASPRMFIDSSGNVGIGTSSPTDNLSVGTLGSGSNSIITIGASTTGTSSIYFGDGASAARFRGYFDYVHSSDHLAIGTAGTERMRIDSSGHITSLPTYNNGSASSANMVVNSSGLFLRSVSSAKYKTNIEDVQDAYADSLLNIRPVYYRSTLENDNTEHSHWGFIAEEVAEIDPRLVHYKTVDITYSDDGERIETELETPEPEGVQYDRFAPLMLKLIQKQQATITALEARITQLENN